MGEPYRSLYEGAAAACLAALHGRIDLWKTARKRLAATSAKDLSCWDRSVYLISTAIVAAHQADPHVRFKRGSAETASSCPELVRVAPAHGPRAGGYKVEIIGRNLPTTLNILWDYTKTVTARRSRRGAPLMLVVPRARPKSFEVVIKILDAYRIESVYAGFSYDR